MTHMLSDKVVVVTGASSGIGRGVAIAAAAHGARAVVIGDLVEEPREGGERTAQLVERRGTTASFVRCDVTSADDLDQLLTAAGSFGGVDLMVCNAGIALATDGPELPAADFARLLAINLQGVLASAQVAAAQMTRLGKTGSIVLMSSMGGIRASALTTGYSASKGGVNLLAASLADAYGPCGIRVNAICPGLVNTALSRSAPDVAATFEAVRQRMPLRRIAEPGEIGDVAAWLGSDFSSFVTGVALPVDGGLLAVI